jgi:hypothetical protein
LVLYSLNILELFISSLRFLLNSKNSSSMSMPKNRLFKRFAAIPVVLPPVNGSNIQAFCLVEAKINLAKTDNGFCVGCLRLQRKARR